MIKPLADFRNVDELSKGGLQLASISRNGVDDLALVVGREMIISEEQFRNDHLLVMHTTAGDASQNIVSILKRQVRAPAPLRTQAQQAHGSPHSLSS